MKFLKNYNELLLENNIDFDFLEYYKKNIINFIESIDFPIDIKELVDLSSKKVKSILKNMILQYYSTESNKLDNIISKNIKVKSDNFYNKIFLFGHVILIITIKSNISIKDISLPSRLESQAEIGLKKLASNIDKKSIKSDVAVSLPFEAKTNFKDKLEENIYYWNFTLDLLKKEFYEIVNKEDLKINGISIDEGIDKIKGWLESNDYDVDIYPIKLDKKVDNINSLVDYNNLFRIPTGSKFPVDKNWTLGNKKDAIKYLCKSLEKTSIDLGNDFEKIIKYYI